MIAIPLTRRSINGKISDETRLQDFNLLLQRYYRLQEEELIEDLTVVIKPKILSKIIDKRVDSRDVVEAIGIYLRILLKMQKDEAIDLTISFISNTPFCSFYHDYHQFSNPLSGKNPD